MPLLLLRPERVLFRSRFGQRGIILSHFGVVGEVALHVAVQQIALFQAQRLAPGSEPFQFGRVNGPSPLDSVTPRLTRGLKARRRVL